MKILLTIEHTHILLPDDSGLATIMKALSRGILVYDHSYRLETPSVEYRGQVSVEMKTVPHGVRLTGIPEKKPKRLALPEPNAILL